MKKISFIIMIMLILNLIIPITYAIDDENNATEDTLITEEKEILTLDDNDEGLENELEIDDDETNIELPLFLPMSSVFNVSDGKTIEEGIYTISSALNSNMVLDISGGSISSGANLQLWTYANVYQQKFHVTYDRDGYYIIEALHSKKALDVAGASKSTGTIIWQYDKNYTDAQKWIIKDAGNGYYSIISKCNELAVDVFGGIAENGRKVHMYTENGTNAQKFKFENPIEKNKTIKEGIYTISSALNSNMVLDIAGGSISSGANLQLWAYANVYQQKFSITYDTDGYYTIEALHSKKVLDVAGASKLAGTTMWQYDKNYTDAQKWIIKDAGNGYYSMISKCNGLSMEVAGGIAENGKKIHMYTSNGTNAQKFKFEKPLDTTKTIEEGIYTIRSALNSNMVLDIAGAATISGANLQLWTYANVAQQKFYITYNNDGSYIIEALHSRKVLDVASASASNGATIWQYDKNYTNAQKWIIKDAGSGYYTIMSMCNRLNIDVAGGIAENGRKVHMYSENSTNAQKFKFEKANFHGIDVSEWNGVIDWGGVKSSGIDFAIIRIGYRGYETGRIVEDSAFQDNIKNAKLHGIRVGVYFFTQAISENEAREEANWIINTLKQAGFANVLDFPIVIDTEESGAPNYSGRADKLSVNTRTSVCKTFCETIKNNGYIPMIYASKSWLENNLNMSQLNQFDIWLAQWSTTPTYTGHYEIWQYISTGKISGIRGNVDLNIGYKKY